MQWRMRLWQAAALAVSLGAALALAEGVLAAAEKYAPDPPWYPGEKVPSTTMSGRGVLDLHVGWKLAPGPAHDRTADFDVTYAVGSDGWRSTPAAHAAGEPTVVFIGDSYTFGTGVADRETFVAEVGRLSGWRVVNLGMAGFGVDQMWQALVHEGLAHRPKLVVATFVLDDLVRSRTAFRYRNGWIRKPTFVLEEGELVPRRPEHSPARLARWFERDTRLGELWRRAARKLELATGLGEGWELNRALFEAMRDACRAGGAELAVVFLPSGGQFEPNPMFERAFGELEIRFLDLGTLPCADPRALFFEHDPHLNAAGQRWVGTVLCDFLDDVGLCKATG